MDIKLYYYNYSSYEIYFRMANTNNEMSWKGSRFEKNNKIVHKTKKKISKEIKQKKLIVLETFHVLFLK